MPSALHGQNELISGRLIDNALSTSAPRNNSGNMGQIGRHGPFLPRDNTPLVTADSSILFFNSTRRGYRPWARYDSVMQRYDEDIYYALPSNDGSGWGRPVNLGPDVNSSFDDAIAAISPDGHSVFFTSLKQGWEEDGGPYYVATLKGTEWNSAHGMGGGITDFFVRRNRSVDFRVYGAAISPDGNKFYFATTLHSPENKHQIWVSSLDSSGNWDYPQLLSSAVNAGGGSYAPHLGPDGKTLFFASIDTVNGREAVYATVAQNDGWQEPVLLGVISTATRSQQTSSVPVLTDPTESSPKLELMPTIRQSARSRALASGDSLRLPDLRPRRRSDTNTAPILAVGVAPVSMQVVESADADPAGQPGTEQRSAHDTPSMSHSTGETVQHSQSAANTATRRDNTSEAALTSEHVESTAAVPVEIPATPPDAVQPSSAIAIPAEKPSQLHATTMRTAPAPIPNMDAPAAAPEISPASSSATERKAPQAVPSRAVNQTTQPTTSADRAPAGVASDSQHPSAIGPQVQMIDEPAEMAFEPPDFGLDAMYTALPEVKRLSRVVLVSLFVTDQTTGMPVPATITIEDLQESKVVYEAQNDTSNGKYTAVLQPGRDYGVSVRAEGFVFLSDRFTVSDDAEFTEHTRNFKLDRLEKGRSFVVNNVVFAYNSDQIDPKSRLELDRLIDLLKQNPAMRIEVGGHTDNIGSASYNKRLSFKRARSVASYLMRVGGLDSKRIEVEGYGESKPTAPNNTEEGRHQNRRTEVKVLSM
jgi:outer membrane protein OmpA-like peptidoglycan-associated protein